MGLSGIICFAKSISALSAPECIIQSCFNLRMFFLSSGVSTIDVVSSMIYFPRSRLLDRFHRRPFFLWSLENNGPEMPTRQMGSSSFLRGRYAPRFCEIAEDVRLFAPKTKRNYERG
jgi:hypothetical protein